MKTLILIPARGGSKGIPRKNIKELAGKPLISYTIKVARSVAADSDICVSTDDLEITDIVKSYGLGVPFIRPAELASDEAGSYEVILHAVEFFENLGVIYDNVLLLQPTSPFRKKKHLKDVIGLYSNDLDMVVSVCQSHESPYFSLYEEKKTGFLKRSKKANFETRQSAPPVYCFNGSMYLINIQSLKKGPLNEFTRVKKYVMDDYYSVDIDSPLDWAMCETMIKEGYVKKNKV